MADKVSSQGVPLLLCKWHLKNSTGPIGLCYSRAPFYISGNKRKILCYKLQVYLPQFYSFMSETAAFTFETHILKLNNRKWGQQSILNNQWPSTQPIWYGNETNKST